MFEKEDVELTTAEKFVGILMKSVRGNDLELSSGMIINEIFRKYGKIFSSPMVLPANDGLYVETIAEKDPGFAQKMLSLKSESDDACLRWYTSISSTIKEELNINLPSSSDREKIGVGQLVDVVMSIRSGMITTFPTPEMVIDIFKDDISLFGFGYPTIDGTSYHGEATHRDIMVNSSKMYNLVTSHIRVTKLITNVLIGNRFDEVTGNHFETLLKLMNTYNFEIMDIFEIRDGIPSMMFSIPIEIIEKMEENDTASDNMKSVVINATLYATLSMMLVSGMEITGEVVLRIYEFTIKEIAEIVVVSGNKALQFGQVAPKAMKTIPESIMIIPKLYSELVMVLTPLVHDMGNKTDSNSF